jgi:hypothetical protein
MKNRSLKCILALAALLAGGAGAQAAYDVNGVKLGDSETAVKKTFPSIRCKPLEWKTDAADRRCDDAKISFSGVEARVTFYLKADAVQGFDVRFDVAHVNAVADFLKRRWGAPFSEVRDSISRKEKEPRESYKVLWEQGRDRVLLSSLSTGKRVNLTGSRGNFENEIYRIK